MIYRQHDKAKELVDNAFITLEDLTRTVLSQIRPDVENGLYNLIIGDDITARIPTIVLSGAVTNIYEQHGYEHPSTIHVAGRGVEVGFVSPIMRRNFEEEMATVPPDRLSGRTLLVTETTETGATVSAFGKLLQEQGLEFDVASLTILKDGSCYHERGVLPDTTRFVYARREYAAEISPFLADLGIMSGLRSRNPLIPFVRWNKYDRPIPRTEPFEQYAAAYAQEQTQELIKTLT